MDYTKLSKEVSYALRHHPEKYGLVPDEAGYVLVEDLVSAINRRHPNATPITRGNIEEAVRRSDKRRHELQDNKIRALYGHSYQGRQDLVAIEPPSILYHGTAPRSLDSIMREGLRPMGRQLVHLSASYDMAVSVGSRHSRGGKPVVLIVDAASAWADGIEFYKGNDDVWLCSQLPSAYLRVDEQR